MKTTARDQNVGTFLFKAEQASRSCLRCSTTTEFNNSGYEIEHSLHARNFETIGFRKGKGESKDIATYQFVDEHPLLMNYYQLNQIDVDGKSTHSRNVQVSSVDQAFTLYPIAAKDN